MSIKDKLIFCGNSSIDHIITHRGTKDVIGGSAVNAAIAGSLFGNWLLYIFNCLIFSITSASVKVCLCDFI